MKRKKSYLAKFEAEVYQLFLGKECKRAWGFFNESQSSTELTSPQACYDMQSHSTVRNAIDKLQFGRAQDCDGLVAELCH